MRLRTKRHMRLDAGHRAMNTRPQALAEILSCEANQWQGVVNGTSVSLQKESLACPALAG
jgi:hypothetical protein